MPLDLVFPAKSAVYEDGSLVELSPEEPAAAGELELEAEPEELPAELPDELPDDEEAASRSFSSESILSNFAKRSSSDPSPGSPKTFSSILTTLFSSGSSGNVAKKSHFSNLSRVSLLDAKVLPIEIDKESANDARTKSLKEIFLLIGFPPIDLLSPSDIGLQIGMVQNRSRQVFCDETPILERE